MPSIRPPSGAKTKPCGWLSSHSPARIQAAYRATRLPSRLRWRIRSPVASWAGGRDRYSSAIRRVTRTLSVRIWTGTAWTVGFTAIASGVPLGWAGRALASWYRDHASWYPIRLMSARELARLRLFDVGRTLIIMVIPLGAVISLSSAEPRALRTPQPIFSMFLTIWTRSSALVPILVVLSPGDPVVGRKVLPAVAALCGQQPPAHAVDGVQVRRDLVRVPDAVLDAPTQFLALSPGGGVLGLGVTGRAEREQVARIVGPLGLRTVHTTDASCATVMHLHRAEGAAALAPAPAAGPHDILGYLQPHDSPPSALLCPAP